MFLDEIGLHLLVNLLWIALLVILVLALVRWLTRDSGPTIPFSLAAGSASHQQWRFSSSAMPVAKLTQRRLSRCASGWWRQQRHISSNPAIDLSSKSYVTGVPMFFRENLTLRGKMASRAVLCPKKYEHPYMFSQEGGVSMRLLVVEDDPRLSSEPRTQPGITGDPHQTSC